MAKKAAKPAKTAAPKIKKPKKEKVVKAVEADVPAAPAAASSSIVIEKDIPIPATVRNGGASPYPFGQMEVNDSFIIKSSKDADLFASDEEFGKALLEDYRTIANRLSGAVRRFTKKTEENFRFRVKTVPSEGGVRVWRVE